MSKARIIKKHHTRFLADFLVECSQDEVWKDKMQKLGLEDKLDTAVEGYPQEFSEVFPEAAHYGLHYCVERLELADIPRAACCWWPIEADTHYYVAYPAAYPEASIYMAIDFDDHSECCH